MDYGGLILVCFHIYKGVFWGKNGRNPYNTAVFGGIVEVETAGKRQTSCTL